MKFTCQEMINFTEEERESIRNVIDILDELMDISIPNGYAYATAHTCMQLLAGLLFDDSRGLTIPNLVNPDKKEE